MSMSLRTSAKPVKTSVKGYCQTTVSARKRARAKTIQVEYVGSMHRQFGRGGHKCSTATAGQAVSDRQTKCTVVRHDCSYTAGIPLLAHGLSVN